MAHFQEKSNAAYLNAGYMNGKGYANAHNTNYDYINNTNNANTNYNNKGIGKGCKTGAKERAKAARLVVADGVEQTTTPTEALSFRFSSNARMLPTMNTHRRTRWKFHMRPSFKASNKWA